MKPLRFSRPDSLQQAGDLLLADTEASLIIAGGTDLLGEIKEGGLESW